MPILSVNDASKRNMTFHPATTYNNERMNIYTHTYTHPCRLQNADRVTRATTNRVDVGYRMRIGYRGRQ